MNKSDIDLYESFQIKQLQRDIGLTTEIKLEGLSINQLLNTRLFSKN